MAYSNEPDYDQCLVERAPWPKENGLYYLPPTGYLMAICLSPVTLMPISDDVESRAEFEVTEPNGIALYRTIRWHYAMNQCGIMFREPMPNINASTPYTLKRINPLECPDLWVTIFSLAAQSHA
jgi:hypothetical protein